jgi:hypothetical protein
LDPPSWSACPLLEEVKRGSRVIYVHDAKPGWHNHKGVRHIEHLENQSGYTR